MNGYRLARSALFAVLLLAPGLHPALADTEPDQAIDRIETVAEIDLGYRGTSVHGTPGRAREYDSLESSPYFTTRIFTDQGPYHLDLDINYLNDKDYSATARLDTQELFHLELHTERFFHNLDHIPYDNGRIGAPADAYLPRPTAGPAEEGSRPDAYVQGLDSYPPPQEPLRAYYDDLDPGERYGLRLDTSEVRLKIKCPDYPAHLTLSYWRYEKQGDSQLRSVSEGGIAGTGAVADSNCVGCHMRSSGRKTDLVTEEVKLGADAHAGYLDMAVEALVRTFRNHDDTPVGEFGVHSYGRTPGLYAYAETPDSKLTELTLRANTAPSGGLVGSASFTVGKRENQSDLNSIAPVEAETDYTKTAADVTYTPGEHWTVNFRYRLLDMESSNSDSLKSFGSLNPNPLEVRDSIDLTRSWYEALVNYRPTPRLTIKGELHREEIDRSDTGPLAGHHTPRPLPGQSWADVGPIEINPAWQLPDKEVITRAKLGFHSRLLERSALKVSGWFALQRNDDPAYGTSFSDSREAFLAASYAHGPLWGMTANLHLIDQDNDDFEITQIATINEQTYVDRYALDRSRRQQNVSLGAWLTPLPGLAFDLNYGYLRTAITQDLLFGAGRNYYDPAISYALEDEDVDYRQTVQTVSAGLSWQATEQLACRLTGYHIRSKADYSPNFPTTTFPYYLGNIPAYASSADLRAISKVDIRQNGVQGRVSWQFDEHWATSVEATYDDYDEVGNDVFDGSVQTCMVSLSRNW